MGTLVKRILRTAILGAILTAIVGCDDRVCTCPDPSPPPPRDIIEQLAFAYQNRYLEEFTNLFPTAEEAEYLYVFNEPGVGRVTWDLASELRVHQRMFRPEGTPVGDSPVPSALWLAETAVNLTPLTEFQERTDLYRPTGELDPARWRVTEAEYHAELFFSLQGSTDYAVSGRANFVMIDDLAKPDNDPRKYLIYRWEDLGNFAATAIGLESTPATWSDFKKLYK